MQMNCYPSDYHEEQCMTHLLSYEWSHIKEINSFLIIISAYSTYRSILIFINQRQKFIITFAGFCQAKPNVISLASRFQKVEDSLTSKVVLGETQFNNIKADNDSHVNETLSGYATFMRAFRNFHQKSVLFVFSHWPVAKNTTRDLLSYVGLDGVSYLSLL